MDNLSHNYIKETIKKSLSSTSKNKFLIAISGGIDSMLLLKISSLISNESNLSFRAIHINHNLSANSKEMQECCIVSCNKYSIDLEIKNIYEEKKNNIEDRLREKRYQILLNNTNDDESLLTGHHEDDQVETFIYRLVRGSSPKGLSSIKKNSYRNEKILCRPLLTINKDDILTAAKLYNLKYVNDLTNNDLSFDRNYIRKKIIPNIKDRWKHFNKAISHTISLQSDYTFIAQEYCSQIYNTIITGKTLSIRQLNTFSSHIHSIFIKHWIFRSLHYNLSKNETFNLMQIIKSENNNYPKCNLKNNISIIRYNDQLYIVNQCEKRKQSLSLLWDIKNDIKFGESTIYINTLRNEGIYDYLCLKAPITLKNFEGNERIMLNQYNHQNLKKLFQTKSIPKWERDDFILFYAQNELLLAYSDNIKFISSQLR
jgi:tRNA(Ile)-lysidine synthase